MACKFSENKAQTEPKIAIFYYYYLFINLFYFLFFAPCDVKNLKPWQKQLHFNYLRNSYYLLNIIDKFT